MYTTITLSFNVEKSKTKFQQFHVTFSFTETRRSNDYIANPFHCCFEECNAMQLFGISRLQRYWSFQDETNSCISQENTHASNTDNKMEAAYWRVNEHNRTTRNSFGNHHDNRQSDYIHDMDKQGTKDCATTLCHQQSFSYKNEALPMSFEKPVQKVPMFSNTKIWTMKE